MPERLNSGSTGMIPFTYRLRAEARIERDGVSCVVATGMPLNVIRVSDRTEGILRLCDGLLTPGEIAVKSGLATEIEVWRVCEVLNRRGILEIGQLRSSERKPFVTVIIPAKDRKAELRDCLRSVFTQDYPGEKMEIIVVDDGSKDGTRQLLEALPCKTLSHPESRGQSHCRNVGAQAAKGEILAFIDSDCVATATWLRELIPFFEWDEVGAVGGFVDGYFQESSLDRYEKAFSPLNMGKHMASAAGNRSALYVPTCNLLVRKNVYETIGGIKEDMRVGEDVDFCWRMRSGGHRLLYAPYGVVKHKHRSLLRQMSKRRAQYGTSEALLYRLHPEKAKRLQTPPFAVAVFLSICAAVLSLSVFPLFVGGAVLLAESFKKIHKVAKAPVAISTGKILSSILRTHLSFFYFASFHVVRYYLVSFVLLGFLFPEVWLLGLFLFLFASVVDYRVKKPLLAFLLFLFYYALEHSSYQLGVFIGCLRLRTFRSYRVKFVLRMP
jgi:mycofactocin system glycosyltransferase